MPVTGRRDEHGFSVVEVVIAMLLLAVVAAGVSMAFVGSSKLQGVAKSNASLHSAAERVFERLRSDRSWMEPCKSSYTSWCNVSSMAGLSPSADVLKDSALGESSCPGHPGDYHHKLAVASVMAIDSQGDGTGAADKDGLLPDYYRVYVKVDVWCALDSKRLQNPQPAVVDATVDPRGKVPNGTVVVEVCRATNQVDDRMSISGCSDSGGGDTRELPCPPAHAVYSGTPAVGCNAAWSWIAGSGPSEDSPAPYVRMRRDTASFSLNDGVGHVYSSGGAGVNQGNGTYLFKNIPAGTYAVTGLTPSSGALELWQTKVIPTLDNDGVVRVTVQPDVKNRALIPVRPKRRSSMKLKFARRVTIHNVTHHSSGLQLVKLYIPTDGYEGDIGKLQLLLALVKSLSGMFGASGWYEDVPFVENGHCMRGGYIYHGTNSDGDTYTNEEVYNTCTRYDMWALVEWDSTALTGRPIKQGAVMGASYSTTPAPTFRDTISANPAGCASSTLPAFGARVPYMLSRCVSGVSGGGGGIPNVPTSITFAPLSTGLNTGLVGASQGSAPAVTSWDDGNGAWDLGRNESAEGAIPAGLKQAFWVRAHDGHIITPSGDMGASPTITLIGKGECYWTYQGGSPHLGSCDACKPYIEPLSGQYDTCFLLTKVAWIRRVFYTGGWADKGYLEGEWVDGGARDETKGCDGPPVVGNNPQQIAANCHEIAVSRGGASNSGHIPGRWVPTSHGAAHVPVTHVGDS